MTPEHIKWTILKIPLDRKGLIISYSQGRSVLPCDVINMANIIRNCPLIKAIVYVGMVIFIQHERFFKHNFNYFSHMMVTSMFYLTLTMNYFSITTFCMQIP